MRAARRPLLALPSRSQASARPLLALPSEPLPRPFLTPSRPKLEGPSDFHLSVGRVIEVLRESYPRLFSERPDMSIYSPDITFHRDDGSATLRGIDSYVRMFDAIRHAKKLAVADAELTYRLHLVDDSIRVRWTAKLWLRLPLSPLLGARAAPLHVDGVSVYLLDDAARVCVHRLEYVELHHDGKAISADALPLPWIGSQQRAPEAALAWARGEPHDRGSM